MRPHRRYIASSFAGARRQLMCDRTEIDLCEILKAEVREASQVVLASEWEHSMSDELWRMSAVEAVARLRKGEISPLDLVEASARRIAEVEPAVNALPTLCLDRARDHAKRIMQGS